MPENNDNHTGLLQQDAVLADLLDVAEVGGFEWHLATGEININERWATMLGYAVSSLVPLNQSSLLALIHSDDQTSFISALEHYLGQPAQQQSTEFFTHRYRLKCAHGQWLWVKTRGRISNYTADGEPAILAGVNLDVSNLMGELESQRELTGQLQDLLYLSPSVLYTSTAEPPYRVIYLSSNCQDTLQIDAARMQQNGGWLDLIHPEDQQRVEDGLDIWDQNDGELTETLRYRLRRLDGTYTWVRDTCQRIERDGQPRILAGSIVGIDEQVQKEELLNRIVGVVPGMIYQFRLTAAGHMDYPFVSPKIKDIFGVSPAAVASDARPVVDSIHPEDRLALIASIQRSAETLKPWQYDFRATHDGAHYRWLRGHAVPHRDDHGDTLWHGQILDINALKQTEASLRSSEARLERAQQIARLGHWEYQNSTGEIFWSPMVYSIFGLEHTVSVTDETFTRHVHPADRELVQQAEVESEQTGAYAVAHRIIRPDGRVRWIKQQARVEPEARGGFRFYGTVLDITEQKELEQQLLELSNTDSLTGLYNRRYLMDAGEQALERGRRYQEPVSLLLFDIDRFKAINDRYGHGTGDTVIAKVGELLQQQTRSSDVAARLGGEEFALVLENTATTTAREIAEKLRTTMSGENLAKPGQEPLYVTLSIGIATVQNTPVNLEQLLSRADKALYAAKDSGRNKTVVAE